MDKHVALLVKTLQKKKLTLSLAESVTCGLVAHKLSTCPGTSDILIGSIVSYSSEAKNNILKISCKKIDKYTCESQEVTDAMAKNLKKIMKADIYAAVTGLASKGGSETKEKPVGTVFLSVVINKKLFNERKLFRGSPLDIKKKACVALFKLILKRCS